MRSNNSINVNGCSVCVAGEENYTTYQYSRKTYFQYDYRHTNGILFSCVDSSLERCRSRRDEWLKKQSKVEKPQVKICRSEEISVELYSFMEQNGCSDAYELFQSDPDILRINGTQIYFVDVDINETTKYVIYLDTEYKIPKSEIEQMLQHFYTDSFESYFTKQESSWGKFRSLCNGIAYRGGKGTSYTIYKYVE